MSKSASRPFLNRMLDTLGASNNQDTIQLDLSNYLAAIKAKFALFAPDTSPFFHQNN